MKLTEKILAALIFISILLKLFLIPGGGVLLVLSMQLLTIIYFALGFAFFNGIRLRNIFKKASYEGISTMRVVGAVVTGICLSNLLVGILFKLQLWPGANATLIVALIPTIIVLIIILIKLFKNKDSYYSGIQLRIAIIGTIALLLFLLPSISIIKIQFRDHPRYIKAFEEYNRYPTDESSRLLDIEYMMATLPPEDFKQYEEYMKNQGE